MSDHKELIKKYQDRLGQLDNRHSRLRAKSRRFSIGRLIVFGLAAFCIYQGITSEESLWWVITFLILTCFFIFLVHRHLSLKYQLNVVNKLLEINRNEIHVLEQQPSFLNDGEKYHLTNSYTADLDIFGPRSLFHLIQRCFSEPGRKTLAQWFTQPVFEADNLRDKQDAVRSIAQDIDLRQHFLAHGLVHFSEDKHSSIPYTSLMDQTTAHRFRILRWIIPLISGVAILFTLMTSNNNVLLYGFLLNLVITGFYFKTTSRVLTIAEHSLKNLSNYRESLKVLIEHPMETPLLQNKKKILSEAYARIKVLQQRYDLLESRSNPIMGLLLNGTLGFDFFVVTQLQQWYNKHAAHIPEWEKEIGWIEALFSLGNFVWNNPSYTFPDMTRDFGIVGVNIRHPFIPETENVGNNFDLSKPVKVVILTGSNMSGKSTFLRSLGINQVLALAGSVVAADHFHTGLFGVLSSFRKSDSIQEHTSLFYDELKKLHYIFATLEQDSRPHLVLLDEILRGTNSDDKYFGSKQILLRLKDENVMTILATHDIDLSRLEDEHQPAILNFSFESQIIDDELQFDYKLRRGVAINKNATFLMRKMGII